VANYIYEVTKLYNRFYHDCPILKEEDNNIKIFRLQLSKLCAQAIANAMYLLGIVVPEKM
jgi:arginyl-tRNA synthetase